MNRIIAVLTILLLLGMSACKPTPDKAIVISKNSNDNEISPTTLEYKVPDEYRGCFVNGMFEVNFHAEVQIPNVDRFSLVKVNNAEFSQEQVDKIVAYLMKGKPLKNLQVQKTRAQLEQIYVEYKALIADVKLHPENYGVTLEEYENSLRLLEEQIENAPEFVDEEENKDGILRAFSNGISGLSICADLGKTEPAVLMIDNRDGKGEMTFRNGDSYKDVQNPALINGTPKNVVVNKEKALELANEAVRGIGADYMQFAAYTVGVVSEKGEGAELEDYKQQCHMFYFTRSFDGIKITYTDLFDSAFNEDSGYNQTILNEIITVCVDDGGVSYIRWVGNSQILGYELKNAALLPFDELIEIGKQQLINKYAWNEDNDKRSIEVKKIVLGYMMIPQKNNSEYNLFVPVWDFFGDSNNTGYCSFITLNALDGSSIDRNLGY